METEEEEKKNQSDLVHGYKLLQCLCRIQSRLVVSKSILVCQVDKLHNLRTQFVSKKEIAYKV